MNIGLSEKAIKTNLENLDQYLADLKVLSTKTQGYHWNIIDPGFHSHHKFFEELYGVQLEMIDGAAERMRKLGAFAPADMTHFVELSTLESDSKETSFQNMMKALVSDEITIGRRKISVQCSAGAVLFPEQIESRFDVISCAENALQQAKERGRNQCSLFAPEMLAIKDAARELEEDLSSALQNNDELSMVYQPKVDAHGRLTGSEALLRWHHPVKGFISPAHFIPIAEETGLIHELGKWVLRRVFDQLRDWQQRNVPLYRVSINVTASQFAEGDFIHYLLV